MKKILYISLFVLFLAAAISLIGYIYYVRGQQKISLVKVNIIRPTEDGFLEKEKIRQELNEKTSIDIKNVSNISLKQLESHLAQNPFIEKADVLLNIHSELLVNVKEKIPVIRVFNETNESFYIDDQAKLFPLSSDYFPKLAIASGKINCSYLGSAITPNKIEPLQKDLCEMGKLLSKNQFLKAQITQVYVTDEGEYELLPLLGEHLILFGKMENAKEKLENLEVFYKNILVKKGWDTYATINLQFRNQVVCIK
jgi:cell division protein FtsQ